MDGVDSKTVLMSMEGTLMFTKDGEWRHDGELVTHQGVADFFSKHLRYDETTQSYTIAVQGRAVSVLVEDCPVVVKTLTGNAEAGWNLSLSGGTYEPLDEETLFVGKNRAWYCLVHSRTVRARFLRSAVQHFLPFVDEFEGKYFLRTRGKTVSISVEHPGE